MEPPQRVLLVDLDDCLMGALWPSMNRPYSPVSRRVLARFLNTTADHAIEIIPLTNRPPAQLAVAASILGTRLCLTESGSSIWCPEHNVYRINPRYMDYATTVRPRIMAAIAARIPLDVAGPYFEEAGNKQCLVCVVLSPHAVATGTALPVPKLAEILHNDLASLPVTVKEGGGVDIVPRGLTKEVALEWLVQLFPEFYGEHDLDWRRVLYVDDNMPLGVARHVTRRGGRVGCPANADPPTRRVMAQVGGWIAEARFEAGVLELVERWCAQPPG